MPYGPARLEDRLSGPLSVNDSMPMVLSIQFVRLAHVGQAIPEAFSIGTPATESSASQSLDTAFYRQPTEDLEYDQPRRIRLPVSGQGKPSSQFVGQVMQVDTRRRRSRRSNIQRPERYQPFVSLGQADHFV